MATKFKNGIDISSNGIIINGSSSGSLTLKAVAAAGSGVNITLPATSGTVVTTGDSGTVTSTMIADATIAPGDLSIGSATTSGNTPSATAADKIISAGTTVSSQPVGSAQPTGGFSVDKVVDSWSDPFAHTRSSECSPFPRYLITGTTTGVTGACYGVRCVYTGNQPSHQFNTFRCMLSSAGSGVTKFVMALWDSTGTLVNNAYTNDLSGSLVTNALVTGATQAAITLTPGAVYYIGYAQVFSTTSVTIRANSAAVSSIMAISPQLVRFATGYATGAPPNLTSTASGSVPWVELY